MFDELFSGALVAVFPAPEAPINIQGFIHRKIRLANAPHSVMQLLNVTGIMGYLPMIYDGHLRKKGQCIYELKPAWLHFANKLILSNIAQMKVAVAGFSL